EEEAMQRTQRGEGVMGRIESETVMSGVAAGFIMGLLEGTASVLSGQSVLLPLRSAASIVLGEDAFGGSAPPISLLGAAVHFSIAVMFGFAYGVANSQVAWSDRVRGSWQAAMGAAFGTLIWVLDFQFIGRLFYPWMLGHSQIVQWAIHAFGFGLPLGLL